MTQGPWSVKGIDPRARSIARERAQNRGVTLGEYLNSLLLEDGHGPIEDVRIDGLDSRSPPADQLRRMSVEIDQLSQKLEASQTRSARAVAGIDKSILGLMGKVDTANKAQLGALERATRAMGEIESAQSALRNRIETLESGNHDGPTLNALKELETSLGRLAEMVTDRTGSLERDQAEFRDLFEEKVSRVSERVDDFARSLDSALKTSSSGLSGRVDEIEQQMSSVERRMEGALGRITDAASRFELFETKAERAVGDTTWRMERALETNLTRSRAMSKELLERVDAIEEKTREAVGSLGEAVTRITDRLARAERASETSIKSIERSVSAMDERLLRGGGEADLNNIQSLIQKRLETLSEDLSRPIHAVRADVERRLEEAMRANGPERVERLERTIRQLQEQLRESESRQADAAEAMGAQVDRLSRAVDERMRAVESRGDNRMIEDVRREMLRLADTIDARLNAVEGGNRAIAVAFEDVRSDVGRINATVDERLMGLEQRSASAIDAVGEQVSLVAERLQRRHDENIQRLNSRLDEASASGSGMQQEDFDRIAERLDERVRDSERRSAEAIGQIGEQVARAADRLQTQHQESLQSFQKKLEESGRAHEGRLSEVLADISRRMDEIGDQSAVALAPVHKTVSSIARRLETLEDAGQARSPSQEDPLANEPPLTDDLVILEDDVMEPEVEPAADLLEDDADNIIGVEPPPFDREIELFADPVKPAAAKTEQAEPATEIEDLLDTDDVLLQDDANDSEIFADLPAEEPRERMSTDYLQEARRAAQQGRRVAISSNESSGRRGIGGPLIASAALAVAVAGGAAWTVMRGKQDEAGDNFARLEPSAPEAAEGDPAAAAADLFGEPMSDPAADMLAPAAETPPAAATPAPAEAAQPARRPVTLADAVRDGEPMALYDYALDILRSGEGPRAVALLKEASARDLVMAKYRLAKIYEKGEGVPRDMAAARNWTEQAAIGGNVKAMHDLAVFYAEGDAGPQSYAAAVEWFRQASEQGLVDSQYNLAVLFEQGLGVSQDKAEAAFWFEVAGRSGDIDGARRARQILGELSPPDAELIKRRARTFNPRSLDAKANGDFGKRPWDEATQSQIAEMQRLLGRLGYATGASDGLVTGRTSEAIRAFERDNSLPVTGEAGLNLLRQLRMAVAAAE